MEKTKNKKQSQWAEVFRMLKKIKMAMLGLIILIILVLLALFADLIANMILLFIKTKILQKDLMPPNGKHWLGTDEFGRDIFARLIHGARVSLKVGILAISISVVVGGILGAISGYFGGLIDNIIMRVVDIFLAVPSILLAIAIVSALGPSMLNLMISISVSYVPNFARIVRASVLSIRDQEFIEAAKAIGASNTRIILKTYNS